MKNYLTIDNGKSIIYFDKKNRNIIIAEKIELFIFRKFLTKKINLGKFVEINSFIDSIEVLMNLKDKNQKLIHSKIIIDSMKFIIDKLKDKTLLYLFLGLEESKIEMLDKISFNTYLNFYYNENNYDLEFYDSIVNDYNTFVEEIVFKIIISNDFYDLFKPFAFDSKLGFSSYIDFLLGKGFPNIVDYIVNHPLFYCYLDSLELSISDDYSKIGENHPLSIILKGCYPNLYSTENIKIFNKNAHFFKTVMCHKFSYNDNYINIFEYIISLNLYDLRLFDLTIFDGLQFISNHVLDNINYKEYYYYNFIKTNLSNDNLTSFFDVLNRNNVKINLDFEINGELLLLKSYNLGLYNTFKLLLSNGADPLKETRSGLTIKEIINLNSKSSEDFLSLI